MPTRKPEPTPSDLVFFACLDVSIAGLGTREVEQALVTEHASIVMRSVYLHR